MATLAIPAQAAQNTRATMALAAAILQAVAAEENADGYPPTPPVPCGVDGSHWILDRRCEWVGCVQGNRLTVHSRAEGCPLDRKIEEWLVAAATGAHLWLAAGVEALRHRARKVFFRLPQKAQKKGVSR